MKIHSIFFILVFLSCNNQQKTSENKVQIDTIINSIETQNNDHSKYYTTKDTIIILTEVGYTLQYPKYKFNEIIDNHSEFFNEIQLEPDNAYQCNNDDFGSESGKDVYYILYSYFLKQRNGIEEYAGQRKKIIDIYLNINRLFQQLNYGGTFFGHQISRILGYAEYSVYLLKENNDAKLKSYNINKQKSLYLKSLRQLIDDEIKIDNITLGHKEKVKRAKDLNIIVDDLDKQITDVFYLRIAQEFHYRYYIYYSEY